MKTVKQAVLEVIVKYYPHVKNHLIHNACPQHPFSSGQRLRELRKLGVVYTFDKETNTYNFSDTPQELLRELLAGEDEKGGVEKLNSFNEQSRHPSLATNNLYPTNSAVDKVKFYGCFEIKEGRLF